MAKEVATQKAAAVAEYDYGANSTLGFEGHTNEDYKIPFLGVLQSNSPICAQEGSDARPGMIINTVTGDLYKGSEGIPFVPVTTQHAYIEWVPRDNGGGFVAIHELDSPVVKAAREATKTGKIKLPNGNDLVETFSVYGIALGSEGTFQAVVSFTSTKIKKYKNWMTKARTIQLPGPGGRKINAPLPAHRYRLLTVGEKNTKGSFFNWEVKFDGENAAACRLGPQDELFQEAVALNDLVKSGVAKANMDSQAKTEGGGEADGGAEIPF